MGRFNPKGHLLAMLVAGLLYGSSGYAAEWYVSPSGSGNGSAGAPFGKISDGTGSGAARRYRDTETRDLHGRR